MEDDLRRLRDAIRSCDSELDRLCRHGTAESLMIAMQIERARAILAERLAEMRSRRAQLERTF